MGAWNATIFGKDTSPDIKEEFFRKYNLGEERYVGYENLQKIMKKFVIDNIVYPEKLYLIESRRE